MIQYTIKQEDIGKNGFSQVFLICSGCNNEVREYPFEPLGRVLKQDVGKICKNIDGCWYVENQEQFNTRTNLNSGE